MAAEKNNKDTASKPKTTTAKTKKRSQKEVVLYSFIGVLGVISILFAYNVVDYFYLTPMKIAGKPLYGNRTENIVEVADSVVNKAVSYGEDQSGVDEVNITVQGPVIYIDVRVSNSTALSTAQKAAEKISDYLIDEINQTSKDSATNYDFQLVVSSGDITKLAEENREAELEHIKENDMRIVDEVVTNAEKYPTAANIQRANANIDLLAKTYKEEAEAFRQRIGALTELTAEQEEALGEIPTLVVDKNVPTSAITENGYPSWGTIDPDTGKYTWK